VDDGRRPEVRLRPDRRYTVVAALGCLAAVGAAVLTADTAGRLLALVAAAVLAAYAVGDLVFSPRVVATNAGVAINSPLLRRRLAWGDIEDVRADTRYRFGLRSTTLEIDAGATLAVFGRRSIGVEPAEAAELLRAFRPPPAAPPTT
jgi:hypothetical protein